MKHGRHLRASFVVAMAWAVCAEAQTTRPRAALQPEMTEVTLAPGASADLVLKVSMPPEVHVQAHQPKDPLLIPTVLTVEASDGVTVESVAYPAPSEFAQAGRADPLLVLGPTFDIRVRLAVGSDAADGVRSIPVVLRYQACNDTVCFPPSRATAAWTLKVERTRVNTEGKRQKAKSQTAEAKAGFRARGGGGRRAAGTRRPPRRPSTRSGPPASAGER